MFPGVPQKEIQAAREALKNNTMLINIPSPTVRMKPVRVNGSCGLAFDRPMLIDTKAPASVMREVIEVRLVSGSDKPPTKAKMVSREELDRIFGSESDRMRKLQTLSNEDSEELYVVLDGVSETDLDFTLKFKNPMEIGRQIDQVEFKIKHPEVFISKDTL